jgi:multidrug efflux pump subunit AcrA (membrane-fusion protein)
MSSITGIIKKCLSLYGVVLLMMALAGCKHGAAKDDDDDSGAGSSTVKTTARVEVKAVSPRTGPIAEGESLNATTVFLLNDVVRAPIAGYIRKIEVTPGQAVKQGDVLFSIQSKEAAAIPGDTMFPSKGMIQVRATEAGVVKVVDRQQGDYMQDGDELCTIANNSSLVFMLDVPFELHKYVKLSGAYTITLPDGEVVQAHITSQIPEMDKSVQMERYVLRVSATLNLPEGLIANVKIPTVSKSGATILPKSAVLSDETQTDFWVMKVVHDTLAIKTPVEKGIETKDSVEIKSPALLATDKILVSGNYGLSDTAYVKVMQ